MKIEWKKDCEVEIITSYDESNDSINTENELFKAGEIYEVDMIDTLQLDNGKTHIQIQFGDGSVATIDSDDLKIESGFLQKEEESSGPGY